LYAGAAFSVSNEYMRLALAALLLTPVSQGSAYLSEETVKAFDAYIKQVETHMDSPALAHLPASRERAIKGEIVAVPFPHRNESNDASFKVPDGLVNHWLGAMFISGATVDQVRAVLQDYANYSRIYAPDVTESKLIKLSGDAFDIFLRLHRQVRIKALLGYSFPVEFNSNYHVRYYKTGETLQVRSASTRIAEVRDPKKSHSEEMTPGSDNGYLWRLRSYWRVYPAQGGVLVECEAVSLSRSVPGFVEKMVSYFTTNFPEDSMRNTLRATREAVGAKHGN
jgi:hypothetical protein